MEGAPSLIPEFDYLKMLEPGQNETFTCHHLSNFSCYMTKVVELERLEGMLPDDFMEINQEIRDMIEMEELRCHNNQQETCQLPFNDNPTEVLIFIHNLLKGLVKCLEKIFDMY